MEYRIYAIRSRAGRARDSIHRGVFRRVPAQEDRRGDRPPAQRPRAPHPARDARRCPTIRASVVPVSFKVAHEITRAGDRAEARRSGGTGCATTCSSTAGASSTPGSAARGATGAARGSSARSPSSRSSWAIEQGFDEIVVKTKNKFYDMRGTLDHLRFEVVKYERERRRQRRVEGVSEQEAPAGDDLGPTAARRPSSRSGRSNQPSSGPWQAPVVQPFPLASSRLSVFDMCARRI